MRFVIFTHSLVSDWNHGNAHFLRGIATELLTRGHHLKIFEPENGWSRKNLLKEHGPAAIDDFYAALSAPAQQLLRRADSRSGESAARRRRRDRS